MVLQSGENGIAAPYNRPASWLVSEPPLPCLYLGLPSLGELGSARLPPPCSHMQTMAQWSGSVPSCTCHGVRNLVTPPTPSTVSISGVSHGLKLYVEDSRNNQSMSFKSLAALSRVLKSLSMVLPPTWDVNHPFVQHIHAGYASLPRRSLSNHLRYQMGCPGNVVFVFKLPFFDLTVVPECKSTDASISDIL